MITANIDSLSALDHFARIGGIDLCDSCAGRIEHLAICQRSALDPAHGRE